MDRSTMGGGNHELLLSGDFSEDKKDELESSDPLEGSREIKQQCRAQGDAASRRVDQVNERQWGGRGGEEGPNGQRGVIRIRYRIW